MTFSQRVSNEQITEQSIDQVNKVIYRLFLSKVITGQSSNIMLIPYVEVLIFPLGAMYVKKNSTYGALKSKAVCTNWTFETLNILNKTPQKKCIKFPNAKLFH